MYVCIECGARAKDVFLRRYSVLQVAKCASCSRSIDRYFELNDTIKLVDLLLIKRRVFRHFLFNLRRDYTLPLLLMLAVLLLAEPVFRLHRILGVPDSHVLVYSLTFLYPAVLRRLCEVALWMAFSYAALHSHASLPRLFQTLVLSSYYHLFIFVMMVWEYPGDEHLLVIEFLSQISNSVAVAELCGIRNETAIAVLFCCRYLAGLVSSCVN
jgi:lipid intermediate transporter